MSRILLLIFAISVLGSCAKKVAFNPSTVAPGATGSVKIKRDKNKNYAIDLKVRNLPKAEDLQPRRGATQYG